MSAAAQTFLANPRDLPQRGQSSLLTVENGVGVVAMSGPMIRNPDLLSQILFNAVDTEEITAAVREAANRPDIEAVFLDIDSPGGTVTASVFSLLTRPLPPQPRHGSLITLPMP